MLKYEIISTEMRKRIKNKYYSIDQPIPDEISLANEFACSRMTMKRALDILVSEGLLYRKRGHGTFIVQTGRKNPNRINVGSDEELGLSELLKNKKVTSKVIKFDVQFPSEEVAEHLAIDTKTPVYYVVRVRLVEDEPYVIEKTYMPTKLIPRLNEEVIKGSIYSYIRDSLGLTIAGSHRKIRACKSDELDHAFLNCRSDDPILELEHVGYLNNGIPFEYSFSRHRYDKFEVTAVNLK